nr:cell envelope integrity protein CreD [Cyclobacteriaceae bacterium]
SPSFIGEFLPANRTVNDSSFTADWKILHFNRALEDFWTGTDKRINNDTYGIKLVIPADQYQKSIRTAKYGQLIILLTFLALFLVEVIRKTRIHPFQYLLIAAALIIYYSLLLSISEQAGFNFGYAIASLLTITLVSWYTRTFLPNRNLTFLFAGLMLIFYGFIFIIIVQQELSLLLGSIGLFLIIAMVMYFSRHINWYKQNE